ncbi:MAG TPA: hypothetical protein PLK90_01530 [Clostridiales bacterium]|nr:hypothetical protein [Clostridiales bacterium]HQP69059.1 hypothetical protein [Clostridiales bacterium]
MKKTITAIILTAALAALMFAQPGTAQSEKMTKPGIVQANDVENCDGYGPMHKGMGKMHKNHGKNVRNDDFDRQGQHFGPMMIENLDLKKDQIEKIHQIKIKYDKADIDLKAELKKLKIDKHEFMSDLNFDKAKEITKKMADVRTKTQMGNIDEIAELTKVLTKEQLEKFKEMHKNPSMMKHNMMKNR